MEQSLFDAIEQILSSYPTVVVERPAFNQMIINANSENGFYIGILTDPKEYTLYLQDFHWHFDQNEIDEVLQLIVCGLTGVLRIKVYSKNGQDYKWIMQQKNSKGQWENKLTTAILNLLFWVNPEIRYLQNDSVFES